MTDLSPVAPDVETPVNPYSLLEAVNRSSDMAHRAWLIFLFVMTYLTVAVAGVTHADLLLETPVNLPILQVSIQLTQFFHFAPIILVLFHLGLVSQVVLLAKETLEFDNAVRLLEPTAERTHPLRLELNNFFFVQAIAGPQRSAIMSMFLHGMTWLTLVILPVVLLLYIQVVFLPYHDVGITWTHRLALMLDILMLILIGVFLMRAETSFIRAFLRTTAAHPISFLATTIILSLVGMFSLFIATIPNEAMDRIATATFASEEEDAASRSSQAAGGFTLPFFGASSDGTLFGLFRRNIVVTDTDLVVDKDQTPGEPSVSLRGRDLRYARLDRADLHQADLTGSNLQGASLIGTDLRGAWLHCADVTGLLLTEDRKAAQCTSARRADFSRARLDGAHMTGIDLRSSKLEEASLIGVSLAYSHLTGTDFSSANLDKADLTGGVTAQGAQFLIASMQGADLTGAQLHFADFSSASLQGAIFNYASMQAAVFSDADLDAASLYQAYIEGTDLAGAKVEGADFRGVGVWMTKPPQKDTSGTADFSEMAVRVPGENVHTALTRTIESIVNETTKKQVAEALAPLLDTASLSKWASAREHARWKAMGAPEVAAAPVANPAPDTTGAVPDPVPAVPTLDYRSKITQFLGRLSCRARWSNGAIATGVARRAQAQHFRGDVVGLYDHMSSDSCPAANTVLPKVMSGFASAADVARSN